MRKLIIYFNLLSTLFWLISSIFEPTTLGSFFIFLGTIFVVDEYHKGSKDEAYLQVFLNGIDKSIASNK